MRTLKYFLFFCVVALLFPACGGGGGGGTSGGAPSITTSPTTCTGGDATTSTAGESFYRLYQNVNWEYSGVYTASNLAPTSYTNVASVGANVLVGATTVAAVSETNSVNQGAANSYYLVNSNGIQDWTLVKSGANSIPVDMVAFPIMVGKQCQQSIGSVNFGDIDQDGKDDFGTIQTQVTILPFENVTVPAATFSNALKTQAALTKYVTLSGSGKTLKEVDNITEWRASDVGLVKLTYQTNITGGDTPLSFSATETLKTRYTFMDNGIHEIVFDSKTDTIFAASIYDGTVYQINAVSGEILSSLPMKNIGAPAAPPGINPGVYNLAISDDSSKLYVGLGTGYIVPINLPSLTVGTPFQPLSGYVGHIEVAPGNPATISMIPAPTKSLQIYSNGVLQTNSATVAWLHEQRFSEDGAKIFLIDCPYAYGPASPGNSHGLNVYTVDQSGVTFASNVPNVLQNASADIYIANGVIYAADGSMVDSTSLNAIGRLAVTDSIYYNVAVDSIVNNVLFVTKPYYGAQLAHLEVFNATTKARIGQSSLPQKPTTNFYEPTHLVSLGNGKFAITNAQGHLYIVYESTLQ
jgi:hypothetical protein